MNSSWKKSNNSKIDDIDDIELADLDNVVFSQKPSQQSSKIDKDQQIAIHADISKPLIITAGPGSGKTRTILERIEYIHEKDPKTKILCVTFSKQARAEMEKRMDPECRRSTKMRTIHSFCLDTINRHKHLLGFSKDLVIQTDKKARRILKEIMKKHNEKVESKDISATWEYIKKNKCSMIVPQSSGAVFYHEYQKKLKEIGALDFNDFILKTIELLNDHPEVIDEIVRQYAYILVDEFQDLSCSQFEVLKMIYSKNHRISIVGDEDQSIYMFRGGSPALFNTFRELTCLDGCTEVVLGTNYRSTPVIVNVFQSVIKNNTKRNVKVVQAQNKDASIPMRQCEFASAKEEIAYVAGEVQKLIRLGTSPNEIAILCRKRQDVLPDFVTALNEKGIACSNEKACKVDLLVSYLAVICGSFTQQDFLDILNFPSRGLANAFRLWLLTFQQEYCKNEDLWQTCCLAVKKKFPDTKDIRHVTKSHESACSEFMAVIKTLRNKVSSLSLSQMIDEIERMFKIKEAFEKEDKKKISDKSSQKSQKPVDDIDDSDDDDDSMEFKDKINALKAIVKDYEDDSEERSTSPQSKIAEFIQYYQMRTTNEEIGVKEGNVFVSTVHQSKGLEWTHVFVVRMNDGVCPIFHKDDGSGDVENKKVHMEEERRIFFVALSRSKVHLTLSYLVGDNKNPPSRFIREIELSDPNWIKKLLYTHDQKKVSKDIQKVLPHREKPVGFGNSSTLKQMQTAVPPKKKIMSIKDIPVQPIVSIPPRLPVGTSLKTPITPPKPTSSWKIPSSQKTQLSPPPLITPKRRKEDPVDISEDSPTKYAK